MSVNPPPHDPGTPAPTPYPATGYGTPPGYGPAPGYPGQPGGPAPYPVIGAAKPPPKKIWYVIAAVLIVVGLVAVGTGVAMILRGNSVQPSAEHTFRSGQSTTIHIDAGETKVIYVANADAAGGHHVDCGVNGAQRGEVEIKRYDGSVTLNQWSATFTVIPSSSGDYTVGCTGAASDTFGVGGQLSTATMVGGILASIAGTFALILGLSVMTVALVLRRRRQQAHHPGAMSSGSAGPPSPPLF